jgi:hypothetical protein
MYRYNYYSKLWYIISSLRWIRSYTNTLYRGARVNVIQVHVCIGSSVCNPDGQLDQAEDSTCAKMSN